MFSNTYKLPHGIVVVTGLMLVGCVGSGTNSQQINESMNDRQSSALAALGEQLFHDVNLSINRTMSCATCHEPQQAFIDNRENTFGKSVSMGADGIKFGTRNTPTVAYAMFSPNF